MVDAAGNPTRIVTLPADAWARLVSHIDPRSEAFEAAECPLTDRQRRMIGLAAQGLTYREIGRRVRIAESTVSEHLHKAYLALGVNSRFAAIDLCVRQGWL